MNICPHSTLPKRNHSTYHADGYDQVAPVNLSQFCAAVQDTPNLNGCRPQGRVLTRVGMSVPHTVGLWDDSATPLLSFSWDHQLARVHSFHGDGAKVQEDK